MKISSAEFVTSSSKVDQCPTQKIPEYAFIGRSNVGKSSLINMLTERKSLAKTSGRPGKTQLINHFIINNQWYLVDLPGYGYARASKKDKKVFQKLITEYFEQRRQLSCAFVLIDIRHDPQPIDQDFMEWLNRNGIPFSIIFTKADKLKPNTIEPTIASYIKKMEEGVWAQAPDHFVSSSLKRTGADEILGNIENINKMLGF